MSAAALSLSLLILAALPSGSIAGEVGRIPNPSLPDAAARAVVRGDGRIGNPSYGSGNLVFRSAFDAGGDLNADGWPDGWRRRVGPGFPSYVAISLAADATAPGGHCLRIELNGGATAAYSPAIEVSPHYAYTIAAAVKTDGLKHDQAYLVWRLLDADHQPIAEYPSAKISGNTPWRELRLLRQTSDDPRVRFAAVGLYVQPGERADLTGSVSLADVRVVREPRLRVSTNQPHNICIDGEPVTLTCQVSGLAGPSNGRSARLTIELIDVSRQDGDGPGSDAPPAAANAWDLPARHSERSEESPAARADGPSTDTLTWTPPLPGVGCYRVRCRLLEASRAMPNEKTPNEKMPGRAELVAVSQDGERLLAEQEMMLAVLPARDRHDRGTFGWSLPLADASPPPQLAELAARLGVAAVKLPLWLDEKDDARRTARRNLIDDLRSRDVRIVGVLANPPASVRKALLDDPAADASLANLLTVQPEKLRPQLRAAIMPWVLQVHDWQLGADTDQSLAGHVDESLRDSSSRLGETRPRAAGHSERSEESRPNSEILRCAQDDKDEKLHDVGQQLAQAGLPVRLALPSGSPAERPWVTIQPQAAEGKSSDARVADFVGRLVAATTSGADAVFIHDPLDPAHGMFQADGSPGELLVPWCTAARQLSAAKYLGRLQLPHGGENSVFERDAQMTVVVWGREVGSERLFIGGQARQIDVWGRAQRGADARSLPAGERLGERRVAAADPSPRPSPQGGEGELIVRVGPTPTFVIGGDPAVVRTQLGIALEPERLPSVARTPHVVTVRVPNCFGRRITGQATLLVPDRWRVVSAKAMPFELPPGGEAALAFRVRMPFDGADGSQGLRVELEIAADKPVYFTVHRELQVGLGDVELTGSARLDEQGNLRVTQQLTNRGTSDVSFACQLLIPGRRPQRVAVRRLPPGTHEHVYTLEGGQELLGKTLRLRADELGGPRVLSQVVVVSR